MRTSHTARPARPTAAAFLRSSYSYPYSVHSDGGEGAGPRDHPVSVTGFLAGNFKIGHRGPQLSFKISNTRLSERSQGKIGNDQVHPIRLHTLHVEDKDPEGSGIHPHVKRLCLPGTFAGRESFHVRNIAQPAGHDPRRSRRARCVHIVLTEVHRKRGFRFPLHSLYILPP